MDDETYVPMDLDQIPGKQYYHARSKQEVSDEHRFAGKSKFPKKYLVWQCLDELGNVSEPFVSTGTINAEIYLNECLKKRMLPFIQKHHQTADVVLWMDMATSHYARSVTDWLTANHIDFIAKKHNAPNVPQARPIETFWALGKAEYKRRKIAAKNLNSFTRIWRNVTRKVAQKSGVALMKSVRRKLRAIAYRGIYALLKN